MMTMIVTVVEADSSTSFLGVTKTTEVSIEIYHTCIST